VASAATPHSAAGPPPPSILSRRPRSRRGSPRIGFVLTLPVGGGVLIL
jgi:hypothetical protein